MPDAKKEGLLPALVKYCAYCQRDGIPLSTAKRHFRAAGGRISNRRFGDHWKCAYKLAEAFGVAGVKRRG